MGRVFGLFIGIDAYEPAVRRLSGCVADVRSIRATLESRLPADSFVFETLENEAATRDGIITAIRSHLGQAAANDTALLYFCGHGGQEACPDDWRSMEPDGLIESLVAIDTDYVTVHALADKELAALLAGIESNGPEIVVITDCCHSMGNTRGGSAKGKPRMDQTTGGARALSQFIPEAQERYAPSRLQAGQPGAPRHIAISACYDSQLASEWLTETQEHRGLFTLSLQEALAVLGPSTTYVDLLAAVRQSVTTRTNDQMPSMAAAGGASGDQLFLGGTLRAPQLVVTCGPDGIWSINAGRLQGVPSASQASQVSAELFKRDAATGARGDRLGRAALSDVRLDTALLAFPEPIALDPKQAYIGELSGIGLVSLRVALAGDATLIDTWRTKIATTLPRVACVEATDDALDVRMTVHPDGVTLEGTDRLPMRPITLTEYVDSTAAAVLSHLARFQYVATLEAPGSPHNSTVRLEFFKTDATGVQVPDLAALPFEGQEFVTRYEHGTPINATGFLINDSKTRLYGALFFLSDQYAIECLHQGWLEPGARAPINEGRHLTFWRSEHPPFADGVTRERLRLIVGREHFDAGRLERKAIDLTPVKSDTFRGMSRNAPDPSLAAWGTTLWHLTTYAE